MSGGLIKRLTENEKVNETLGRFGTVHECDRRTDKMVVRHSIQMYTALACILTNHKQIMLFICLRQQVVEALCFQVVRPAVDAVMKLL